MCSDYIKAPIISLYSLYKVQKRLDLKADSEKKGSAEGWGVLRLHAVSRCCWHLDIPLLISWSGTAVVCRPGGSVGLTAVRADNYTHDEWQSVRIVHRLYRKAVLEHESHSKNAFRLALRTIRRILHSWKTIRHGYNLCRYGVTNSLEFAGTKDESVDVYRYNQYQKDALY